MVDLVADQPGAVLGAPPRRSRPARRGRSSCRSGWPGWPRPARGRGGQASSIATVGWNRVSGPHRSSTTRQPNAATCSGRRGIRGGPSPRCRRRRTRPGTEREGTGGSGGDHDGVRVDIHAVLGRGGGGDRLTQRQDPGRLGVAEHLRGQRGPCGVAGRRPAPASTAGPRTARSRRRGSVPAAPRL